MRGWIEPEAIEARPDHDGQIRLSTAISLKRIADAISKDGADGVITGNFHSLTNLALEMGRSFAAGQRAG